MLIQIKRLKTRIAIIQQIPKRFFRNIETSVSFGNHLFPSWISVFDATDLKSRLEAVYHSYKNIADASERQKIVDTFNHSNKIFELCEKDPNAHLIIIDELHESITDNIKTLFTYLYNSTINYHKFEDYVKDTKRDAMLRFKQVDNRICVCPLCGLESFEILEGQYQPSLDHWLPQSIFPMSAVNFNNLIPIGDACNRRPAKGDRIILFDNNRARNRVVAYHPYKNHSGITTNFSFIREPVNGDLTTGIWDFEVSPNNAVDQNIFASWNSIFNIEQRYKDYFKNTVFPMWEGYYRDYIADIGLPHANNIEELKEYLRKWKSSFQIKQQPGALLYRNFIDYLIRNGSESYLYGIGRNLNDHFIM